MQKGVDFTGIAVVFFCHDGNGTYLAGKRSRNARDERGCWDIGGGGVKHGELLEGALRREVKEEYGADIISHEFLGFREVLRMIDGVPTHWIVFDFKVQINPDDVVNGDPEKIDEICWFRMPELPSPHLSQVPSTMQTYRLKLN